MGLQYTPYVFLPLASAAVLATLCFFALRRRDTPGAVPFAALMLAGCQWKLAYALEMSAADLAGKVFWGQVEYLGLVAVPVAWLAFALAYTAPGGGWLSHRNLALLSAVPLLTLGLAWTNGLHGLVWHSARLDASGPFPALEAARGAWFWVNAAYSYLLAFLGTALLVRGFARSARVYRGRGAALLAGALVTWGSNALHLVGLDPVEHLNPDVLAFPVTGALFAWALFRLRLLDVVPVARDTLIEGMGDGVIVLDDRDRVADLNPAAGRVLGGRASDVVGRGAERIPPPLRAAIFRADPHEGGLGRSPSAKGRTGATTRWRPRLSGTGRTPDGWWCCGT